MKYIYILVIMLLPIQSHASGWEESRNIDKIFNDARVNGTFVLYDATTQTFVGYNRTRSEKRFVPASTFKIPNTLIGLSVGAVENVDEILPYGGNPQPFKVWEKNMNLRDAISLSNVPIYQELARRIGAKRMKNNISKLDFGNADIGTSIDSFWLTGPLKISAIEQTLFLAKLAQDSLPLPKNIQKTVREIVLIDQGDGWKLYGKTGWENAPNKGVGWWVGWVQRNGNIFTFALNMDIQKTSDAKKREELGKSCLKALQIL